MRYDKAGRKQALQRRRRINQFDDDILRAHRGDTEGLCSYLRSELPLSEEQREGIADLINRRIQRKQRGRPRGSAPVPNPAREAESLIVYGVRQLKIAQVR
jgi:hypothetical protein